MFLSSIQALFNLSINWAWTSTISRLAKSAQVLSFGFPTSKEGFNGFIAVAANMEQRWKTQYSLHDPIKDRDHQRSKDAL